MQTCKIFILFVSPDLPTHTDIPRTTTTHFMTPHDDNSDDNDDYIDKGKEGLENTAVKNEPDTDDHDDGDSGKDADIHDPTSKKRKKDLCEEAKLEGRRAANRKSALESRLRRKNLIETLQQQVEKLSKESTEMKAVNENLRKQLEATLSENQHFRLLVAQQQLNSGLMPSLSSFYPNPTLLSGRTGIGGLHPSISGIQPGFLGGINPAGFGSLGSGFLPFSGTAINDGYAATDLQSQMQLQMKKRDAIAFAQKLDLSASTVGTSTTSGLSAEESKKD
jgi:bZIP transcription factor